MTKKTPEPKKHTYINAGYTLDELPNNIRKLRLEKSLIPADLAKLTDFSVRTIAGLEIGNQLLTEEKALIMAQALGCTVGVR